MSTTKKSHIGTILHFNESGFVRKLKTYNSFADGINEFLSEFKRLGLPELTRHLFERISIGDYGAFLDEYKERANKSIENAGFVFRPIGIDLIGKGVQEIISKLSELTSFIKREDFDVLDCPIVEGIAVITPNFEAEVKERFLFRIKTENGSEFYDRFLQAQKAVKNMLDMGGISDFHFEFDEKEGLLIRSLDFIDEDVSDRKVFKSIY